MTLESSTRVTSQLGFLDGLRGLMALWVLASHLIQRSDGPHIFLIKGGIAVDVFMFVSGVLMAHNFYVRKEQEPLFERATWRRFFIRRFFRIAPLYYLLFAFALVFAGPLAEMASQLPGGGHEAGGSIVPMAYDIAAHLSFIYGLFPQTSSSNALPDWSLSLEMQFYVVFPLLLVLMQRRVVLWAIGCLVLYVLSNVAISTFTPNPAKLIHYPQPSLLPLKITCFAAGMLIVQISHDLRHRIISLALLAALLLVQQRLTYTAVAAFACLVYFYSVQRLNTSALDRVGLTVSKVSNRALGGRLFKFLGDVSYGVYLCHFLLLFPILYWAQQNGWLGSSNAWARFLVAVVLVTPPTLLIAWALHITVEKPFIDYGRRIIKRTSPLRIAAAGE